MTSGKSSPGSGPKIASETLRDADVSACIWSPRNLQHTRSQLKVRFWHEADIAQRGR
jgi:hypothetical protein